jgi:hypothetical protein
MVTSEFVVTFSEPIGEMSLNLIGDIGEVYRYSDDLKNLYIEGEIDEIDLVKVIAQYVDVFKVGLIKHTRYLEPVWAGEDKDVLQA